jgi:uncharacterized membrane protein YdjX (TVP38/TMEM64 family)
MSGLPFNKRKKIIIEAAIIIGVLLTVAIVSFFVLMACDVIYFDDGIAFNAELFRSFSTAWYGWIVFILIQSALTMLLCIVPGISMAFIVLCTTIYPNSTQAFAISYISVVISSLVMYLLGRFGGYKLTERLLGKEECEKAVSLLGAKSVVYFPLMMLFPVFPDDALVMLAGTVRMKLRWFIPSILFGRGIGIATIVFGISLIPFESFTTVYDWIVFITVCMIWIYIVFSAANKLSNRIDKIREKNGGEDGDKTEE